MTRTVDGIERISRRLDETIRRVDQLVDNGPSGNISLRDYFIGQAMQNQEICTGIAPDVDLDRWFGQRSFSITRERIATMQAIDFADAVIKEMEGAK